MNVHQLSNFSPLQNSEEETKEMSSSATYLSEAGSLGDSVMRMFDLYTEGNHIGSWDEDTKTYKYKSYLETAREVHAVVSYIKTKGTRRDTIAIMMSNRAEWLVADFAAAITDRIVVGLHSEWSFDKLSSILSELNFSLLICDGPSLELLSEHDSLRNSFDDILNVDSTYYNKLLTDNYVDSPFYNEVVSVGSIDEELEPFTYMYSSGTSGAPKAVATPKKTWRVTNCNPGPLGSISSPSDRRTVSYMSLAHGADRGICWLTSMAGGCLSFTTYPECTPEFYSQLGIIRPTFFLAMSCTWQNIYSAYDSDLQLAIEQQLSKSDFPNADGVF